MFGTYIGNERMLVKLAYNGMLTISAKDLSLMPSLVTTGMIETPLTKFFINNIKPGNTVIDIGANVGYFTVLGALLVGNKGKVIGYEANSDIFPLLQDNISMNWLTQQTTLINKAIYSKNTKLEFYVSNKFQGDSSINRCSTNEILESSYTKRTVEAVSLENELMSIGKIDLLKIDIEGGEYHAFLGMIELIKQNKIKKIVFEWNKSMLGENAEPFSSLIEEIVCNENCKVYSLNQEGEAVPTPLEAITSLDFYPFALIEFC